MWNKWRVFLCTYLLLISDPCAGDVTLLRNNYGTAFVHKGVVELSRSQWRHTFVVDLSTEPLPRHNLVHCMVPQKPINKSLPDTATGMGRICESVQAYTSRIHDLRDRVQKEMDNIDLLLPTLNTQTNSGRQRRAILGFIGQISKSLFGTATESDVNTLTGHIANIQKMNLLNTDELHRIGSAFDSYMRTENARTANILRVSKLNTRAIELVAEDLELNAAYAINFLHIYGVQTLVLLSDILGKIQQEKLAIQDLLRGYLPLHFIPISTLQTALDKIRHSLSGTSFQLAYDDPNYYYYLQDIVYSRFEHQLYIHIKFPLKSEDTTFDLYQIKTFPTVIDYTRNESSLIKIDNDFIGISMDTKYFIEISFEDYSLCHGNQLRRCDHIFTLRETASPSCALAIFKELPRQVAQLCPVNYQQTPFRSQVLPTGPSSYLVSTLDRSWILACPPSPPVHFESCSFCEITLPCRCSLRTDTLYIAPTLGNCSDMHSTAKAFALNLPALYKFYDDKRLYNITSGHFTINPVDTKIPSINVITAKVEGLLNNEDDRQFSLDSIARHMEKGNSLFADRASYILNSLGLLSNTAISASTPILTWLATAIALIALFLACYGQYRIVLLARITAALPFLDENVNKPTQIPADNVNLYNNDFSSAENVLRLSHTATIGFIMLCAALIILYLLRKWIKHRNTMRHNYSTTIQLAMFTENDVRAYDLVSVPFARSDLVLTAAQPFIPPRFENGSVLKFTWEFLKIRSQEYGVNLRLPDTLNIPIADRAFVSHYITRPVALKVFIATVDKPLYMWVYRGQDFTQHENPAFER